MGDAIYTQLDPDQQQVEMLGVHTCSRMTDYWHTAVFLHT